MQHWPYRWLTIIIIVLTVTILSVTHSQQSRVARADDPTPTSMPTSTLEWITETPGPTTTPVATIVIPTEKPIPTDITWP